MRNDEETLIQELIALRAEYIEARDSYNGGCIQHLPVVNKWFDPDNNPRYTQVAHRKTYGGRKSKKSRKSRKSRS